MFSHSWQYAGRDFVAVPGGRCSVQNWKMAEVRDFSGKTFEGLYEGWEVEFSSGLILFASRQTDGVADKGYLVSVSDGVDSTEMGYVQSKDELLTLAEAIEKIVKI